MNDDIIKTEIDQTSEPSSHLLSREETREVLTPFAFEIDKTLFGITLAAPSKRAFALLIDLLAIAILSSAPGELLAIVLAVTFYKLGSKSSMNASSKGKGFKRRKVARFIGAFILFVLLIDTLPKLVNYFAPEQDISQTLVQDEQGIVADLDFASTLILAATTKSVSDVIDKSSCNDLACWQVELSSAIEFDGLADIQLTQEFTIEAFTSIAEETQLNQNDKEELIAFLQSNLDSAIDSKAEQTAEQTATDVVLSAIKNDGLPNGDKLEKQISATASSEKSAPVYSILEYAKGIMNDLGLGFGWAAFYFTVLVALWNGQTLGKKLFSIRVLQLDGTPLSLWDSFGRYGGYGAGLATGLLGFLQVFWDPNRQAIHDKISATVVVDAKQSSLN